MEKPYDLSRGFFLAGAIMSLVFASQVVTHTAAAFWGDKNKYWTPAKLAEPLSNTTDVFRLSIAGKDLQEHLEEGTLKGLEGGGKEYTVVADDVRVRVNHYHEHQVRSLESALIAAPLLGLGLGLLIGGLVMRRRAGN